jgi:hypothetical protein
VAAVLGAVASQRGLVAARGSSVAAEAHEARAALATVAGLRKDLAAAAKDRAAAAWQLPPLRAVAATGPQSAAVHAFSLALAASDRRQLDGVRAWVPGQRACICIRLGGEGMGARATGMNMHQAGG